MLKKKISNKEQKRKAPRDIKVHGDSDGHFQTPSVTTGVAECWNAAWILAVYLASSET